MKRLERKTAVITGGSDGIGFAIASAFAENGANLVLVARNQEKLFHAKQILQTKGVSVETVSADLKDLASIPHVTATLLERTHGQIHVLVNNVGVAHFKPLPDLSLGLLDEMVNLNIKVPFLLIQHLLPALTATRGNILNISTYWSQKMIAGRPSSAYSMTRGAINTLTKALANELGELQIRTNAIAPGSIDTSTFRKWLDTKNQEELLEYQNYVTSAYPLGHIGNEEDVANAAVYLASDEAKWVTGTILNIDGGLTVR
ncbi:MULTISPECIES: SDR family NAD(P)-dependent oxidoreductase [unclassified Paenibacillus]|uniref:SDR family NAD(P)-dependent oxidoreductase n=1 Tax=unclassified Paenibacillus TaxID=185978 RepID=UPI00119E3A71|nr:SDR family oxidoreductase [Paenibacillus sp. Y412MC10]